MKRILILVGFLLVLGSCSNVNDCMENYVPGPPMFIFQFIDKDTGDDLFINRKFSVSNLKVVDEKGEKVPFDFIYKKDKVVLILNSIGWNLEKKQYTISFYKMFSVKMLVDIDSVEEKCYTSFKVKSFKIENYEYHQDRNTGIIQIKI